MRCFEFAEAHDKSSDSSNYFYRVLFQSNRWFVGLYNYYRNNCYYCPKAVALLSGSVSFAAGVENVEVPHVDISFVVVAVVVDTALPLVVSM